MGASHIPLSSDTSYVPGDTGVLLGPYFKWTDHDYGCGWLTVDNAMKAATAYVES